MAARGDNHITYTYRGGERHDIPHDATHIIIAKSVLVILAETFRRRPKIKEVEFHDKIEKVEEGAFAFCYSLRRVIMSGVKIFEGCAFYECDALTDVECGKLEIIKEHAFFRCRSLRSINLPSARIVEENAFTYCPALTDVKFGSKLDRIEWAAFTVCTALERITIPLKDGIIAAADIFIGCYNLKQVDLVEGPIHETIAALQLEEWRNDMNEEIDSINQILPTVDAGRWARDAGGKARAIRTWIRSVIGKTIHYKAQHQRLLDEAATTLQLALPRDIVMNDVLPFLELPSYKFELEDMEEEGEGDDGNDRSRRDVTIWRRCFICLANFLMKHVWSGSGR